MEADIDLMVTEIWTTLLSCTDLVTDTACVGIKCCSAACNSRV